MKNFQDLIVWQKSHALVLSVYKITKKYPKDETYGLVSQSRRAAVSIPSNLAEGFKRKSRDDAKRFYNISEASLEELKYQLILGRDLEYLNSSDYKKVFELADEVGKILYAWIKSIK